MDVERTDYWDKFYAGAELKKPLYPSQFAAFSLGEVPDAKRVIEFGCGNGRDSEFFASYGLNVMALDASESAIELCRSRTRYQHVTFAKFALGDDDPRNLMGGHPEGRTILYARFFLHAINDKEEAAFFEAAGTLMESGDVLALEYRCDEDEQIQKEFGQHYRRYLHHEDLCRRIAESGFDIAYQIKGKGFAKYKSEDAMVGRCIATRTRG